MINVLSGHGNISGQALSEHMKVRALSFTGSTRTGRAIAIAAAKSNLKKVVFELGGKSPSLIFEDADIEQAAKEVELSINSNSGQACFATSRVYVQENIKDKFVEALTRVAKVRRLGDPTVPGVNHGPQADQTQYETVQKYISLGKEDAGSTIDTGADATNSDTSARHVHPVIFTDVPEDSRITKEEVRAPFAYSFPSRTLTVC